ncbi:hypothetical protein TIFTF001_039816 [Ficus carica]|uniref:Retrotransposon gag domain-containing protein n=1 Tax=Ficus carica TaxID=3494 RepID=A0AA87YQR4_FICCA|nr:hypothetical protein TIFTF001_039798 [Ficus carica]GMN19437.1 hypothetical protein TIFTF001_039806 [Ficus carica]GMN19442.1 hypothetical protein TIFTF001_039808 [Ficus carica]GMN19474.1 hypothetical protein TIFTF001_039816 [Ficus carica]
MEAEISIRLNRIPLTRLDPTRRLFPVFGINILTLEGGPRLSATTTSSHALPEHPTTIKPWTSEPAKTSRALTILHQPASRAPDDPSVGEVHEHSQYGLEPVGVVDPPFTPAIMTSRYPARFKMPSMASYDGSTEADEFLENYQAQMLIQNANEATLCKAFCLTLTGAARQWYRRLVPGSINSFKQLADAFEATFLGLKTRKMETSYLFGIKQGESEPLKECLDRFDKAVVQIKSCSDDTLIQAFREGVKDRRLVWTLAYDVPPTFAHLRGIAWKHAEADEYVRGRGAEHKRQKGGGTSWSENTDGKVSPVYPPGRHRQARPEPGLWSGTAPGPVTTLDKPCSEKSKQILQFSQRRRP